MAFDHSSLPLSVSLSRLWLPVFSSCYNAGLAFRIGGPVEALH